MSEYNFYLTLSPNIFWHYLLICYNFNENNFSYLLVKMKRLLISVNIFLIIFFASAANATVLLTANPLGHGKWSYMLAGSYNSNSSAYMNSFALGGFLGYGIIDNLDIYPRIAYGTWPFAASLSGISSLNALSFGLALKYTFWNQNSKGLPISIAGILEYSATTITTGLTGGGNSQMFNGDIGLGIIISKTINNCIPYGAIVYHKLDQYPKAKVGSVIELAMGIQWWFINTAAIQGEASYNILGGEVGNSKEMQLTLAYRALIL